MEQDGAKLGAPESKRKSQEGNIPEVDEADYNARAAVDASEFQNVDGDANLPFN